MSTSALLLPLELPMLVLHTGVLVVVIKLANHGDRYKTFYVLYALQNLSELLAFLTVRFLGSILYQLCNAVGRRRRSDFGTNKLGGNPCFGSLVLPPPMTLNVLRGLRMFLTRQKRLLRLRLKLFLG